MHSYGVLFLTAILVYTLRNYLVSAEKNDGKPAKCIEPDKNSKQLELALAAQTATIVTLYITAVRNKN